MFALISVYFTIGMMALESVTSTFFTKNNLTLGPEQLISLGIWASLPWSIKLVFGESIDRGQVRFSRKAFLHLGHLLMVLSSLTMVDHASSRLLIGYLGEYGGLLISGVLGGIGAVLARLVIDTLAVETTDDPVKRAKAQHMSRVSLTAGMLAGALLAGPAATHLSPAVVFGISGLLPLLASLSVIPLKLSAEVKPHEPLLSALGIIAFSLLITSMIVFLPENYGQPAILAVSMLILSAFLWKISPDKTLFAFLAGIFLFRTTPGVGPGSTWYYMDVWKFDQNFFGLLGVTGAGVSLIALGALTQLMTRGNIRTTLIWLTVLMLVVSSPDLLVYYFMQDPTWVKHLVLVDAGAASMLAQLSMVPLGIVIAQRAPSSNRGLYLALCGSLMNLAMMASDLLTKVVVSLFPVGRGDYSNLGMALSLALGLSTVLSVIGIAILPKGEDK